MATRTPKNPRFMVTKQSDGAILIQERGKRPRRWFPTNFVYGQMGYDERTSEYPDYVHGLVWDLVDRSA